MFGGRLSLALLAVLLTACNSDEGPPGVLAIHVIFVRGTVTDDAASPVAGAAVVALGELACDGRQQPEELGQTDSDGRFGGLAHFLTFMGGIEIGCLVVRAEPPAGFDLSSDSVRIEGVVFRPSGPPPDTVTVELQLRDIS